jgi:hypothetical protein
MQHTYRPANFQERYRGESLPGLSGAKLAMLIDHWQKLVRRSAPPCTYSLGTSQGLSRGIGGLGYYHTDES